MLQREAYNRVPSLSPDYQLEFRFQLAFAHHALVGLVGALYSIFKFAIALRQSFGDDIRAAGQMKGVLKKYSLTNLEFMFGHRTVRTRKLSGAIIPFQKVERAASDP
jgi:hypothetical protein